MSKAWRLATIGLGANLGDPVKVLSAAFAEIAKLSDVRNVKASSLYATSPVDSSGPDYVNAVAIIETALQPKALLLALQDIERQFGRIRPAGQINAPRTLDLDLLTYEGAQCIDDTLTLPHPRMTQRLFVLVPLRELEPDWHTKTGQSIAELIETVRQTFPEQKIRLLRKIDDQRQVNSSP